VFFDVLDELDDEIAKSSEYGPQSLRWAKASSADQQLAAIVAVLLLCFLGYMFQAVNLEQRCCVLDALRRFALCRLAFVVACWPTDAIVK